MHARIQCARMCSLKPLPGSSHDQATLPSSTACMHQQFRTVLSRNSRLTKALFSSESCTLLLMPSTAGSNSSSCAMRCLHVQCRAPMFAAVWAADRGLNPGRESPVLLSLAESSSSRECHVSSDQGRCNGDQAPSCTPRTPQCPQHLRHVGLCATVGTARDCCAQQPVWCNSVRALCTSSALPVIGGAVLVIQPPHQYGSAGLAAHPQQGQPGREAQAAQGGSCSAGQQASQLCHQLAVRVRRARQVPAPAIVECGYCQATS